MAKAWPLPLRRNELGAGDDVAPLVAAAHLDFYAVFFPKVIEVVTLHQLVGELCEAHAAFEAILHAVLRHHVVDRDVLSNVSDEVEEPKILEPVVIVDHARRIVSFEVQKLLQLRALTGQIVIQYAEVEELALRGLPAGIAHHACGATHECDGRVPSALPMNEQHDGDEVSDVEAVGCRIKAHIGLDTFLFHQFLGAGHDVMQQPSPFQFFDQRHGGKDNARYK